MAYDSTNQAAPRAPTALDDPRLFQGVLSSRVIASVFDLVVIGVITLLIVAAVLVFGVITLGLGWLLFFLPIVPIVSIVYVAVTMGSPAQATYGMRLANIRLVRTNGERVDGAFAAFHSILFWLSVTVLTPAVLLIGLFTDRRQLGHDLLLGSLMVRTGVADRP